MPIAKNKLLNCSGYYATGLENHFSPISLDISEKRSSKNDV